MKKYALAFFFALLLSIANAGIVYFNVTYNNESTKQFPLISINLTSNYTALCTAGDCNDVALYLFMDASNSSSSYRYKLVNYSYYNDTRWMNNHTFTQCSASSCWAHLVGNWTASGTYLVEFKTEVGNVENQLGILGSNFAGADSLAGIGNSTYSCTAGMAFDNGDMTADAVGPAQICNHRYDYTFGRITANLTDTDAANGWVGFMLGNSSSTYVADFGCVAPNGCVGAVRRGTGAETFINSQAAPINTTITVGGAVKQWRGVIWGITSGSERFINASRAGENYPNALTFPFINNFSNHDDNNHFTMLQFRFYVTTSHFNSIYEYCIMSNIATLDKFGCTFSNLTTGYNYTETTLAPAPTPSSTTEENIEDVFASGWNNIGPDPMLNGLLVFVFFGIFVILQGVRLDAKIAIVVPAAILASLFIPFFAVIVVLILGAVIIYIALKRFFGG